ncbi:unnamed protein product [Didymodactylos carnosus]|uniref:Uncharacterized protein n=1 Tax=Didymodactylos carnosus TaxID=1234261 RepID=A0A814RLF6_9BILA|nr:unnamed protein product [Didymodactylos carnosus]CAF3899494.1 unnamed protein product [Didymodactylos carnosus]
MISLNRKRNGIENIGNTDLKTPILYVSTRENASLRLINDYHDMYEKDYMFIALPDESLLDIMLPKTYSQFDFEIKPNPLFLGQSYIEVNIISLLTADILIENLKNNSKPLNVDSKV